MDDKPKEITYEEMLALDDEDQCNKLKEAGWTLDDNGFWYHLDHREEGYTHNQALEILALKERIAQVTSSRDALAETLRKQRWKDGEGGITYITLSDPPLFHPAKVGSFKELVSTLEAIFEELKDKDKKAGTLVYSLVRKQYEKVILLNGEEVQVSEFFINTLFRWTGKEWENLFGNICL